MKRNKVLKSLDELSSEVLGSQAPHTVDEPTTPTQPEVVTPDTRQIFEAVLKDADARPYRGWGIND